MLDLQQAISLLEQGDAREAARLLEEMSDRMPGYATARVLLARAYEGVDAWDEALHSWRQALHIIPNSPVVRRGLLRAAQMAASSSSLPRAAVATAAPGQESTAGADEREWAAGDGEEPIAADREDSITADREDSITADREDSITADREESITADREESIAGDRWADEGAWPYADVPAETTHRQEAHEWHEPELRREPAAPDVAPAEEETADEHPDSDEDRANGFQEDLDRLISELESARIMPRPDLEDVPTPDLEDDIEDVVSETLAKIYASQGQFGEAARVYEMLASQQPENHDHFTELAAEMRGRASDEG